MSLELNTEDQKFSYGMGQSVGANLVQQGIDKELELDTFISGISDSFAGEMKISPEEINAVLSKKFNELKSKEANAIKEVGENFLAENAKKEGVTVLPSGLQYEIISSGDASGEKPTLSSQVTTHYTGTLINGNVFDSSVERGQPATFPVGGVIAGWTEALQLMVPGDKWRIYLPSEIAYGEQGAGADIPPHSTLIFELELLSIA